MHAVEEAEADVVFYPPTEVDRPTPAEPSDKAMQRRTMLRGLTAEGSESTERLTTLCVVGACMGI